MTVRLIPATDAHFAWMLEEAGPPDGLTLAPGGIDEAWVYRWLRRNLAGGAGSWLMVEGGEVVGMISHKRPPNAEGETEIGYGVAPERRRRGLATQAAGLLVELARADPAVRALTAETALANLPSQRVLEANGFVQTGRGHDADEGEMIVWRLATA